MDFHIINGDDLAEKLPPQFTNEQVIVLREAFMEGPVSTHYDSAYWAMRKNYIRETFGESASNYDSRVLEEVSRLQQIEQGDKVYLWFEDDLFCQCNMWFAVDYISKFTRPAFFRVFPEPDAQYWKGFGMAEEQELINYFQAAVRLTDQDVLHIRKLWQAFVDDNTENLRALSVIPNPGIRFQKEVMAAQIARPKDETGYGRPEKALMDMTGQGKISFYELFDQFSKQEGIYGFSDMQIKNRLAALGIYLTD